MLPQARAVPHTQLLVSTRGGGARGRLSNVRGGSGGGEQQQGLAWGLPACLLLFPLTIPLFTHRCPCNCPCLPLPAPPCPAAGGRRLCAPARTTAAASSPSPAATGSRTTDWTWTWGRPAATSREHAGQQAYQEGQPAGGQGWPTAGGQACGCPPPSAAGASLPPVPQHLHLRHANRSSALLPPARPRVPSVVAAAAREEDAQADCAGWQGGVPHLAHPGARSACRPAGIGSAGRFMSVHT